MYLFVTWRFSTWASYILYQYISCFRGSSISFRFDPSFSAGWSYVFGGEIWSIRRWRWRNLAEAPSNIHNKRSLIRTTHVCHRRLAVGRSQQVKEYKHPHTNAHTHTHIYTHTHTTREKQVFLVGFSLTFPRFSRKSKNPVNATLAFPGISIQEKLALARQIVTELRQTHVHER